MASLQIDRLCFGRAGKALNQPLTMQAHDGEVWTVLGENGAGKTTLLNTLAGLLRPVSGQVSVDGVDIRRCPRKLLARRLGLVMQQPDASFPYSVREVVSAGRYAHGSPWRGQRDSDRVCVERALQETAIDHLANRRIDRLSGGEQRRAAIATLLAQDPGVMLLDEPVHNLDVRHEVALMNHFRHLAAENNKLILMTLHDVNLAQHYADRVLLLYPDGDWETGEPDTLLTGERLERLYGVPLRAVGGVRDHFWVPVDE